jgi:predicted pyridoxine 5'-phosphate oxidase superfamily flavin-nucleotide-binding protein
MPSNFLNLTVTGAVAAAQKKYYGRVFEPQVDSGGDELGDVEREFIGTRDSFYLGTVTETGWPYVQHRGGPTGFLHVVSSTRLAFADLRGNRQMLTTGNVAANDRVTLFLMDYPQRSRLKILGRARILPASEVPDLAAQLIMPESSTVERVVTIDVVAFDWNCPKYITPRYTKTEVEAVIAPLKKRITELEAQLAAPPEPNDFPR